MHTRVRFLNQSDEGVGKLSWEEGILALIG